VLGLLDISRLDSGKVQPQIEPVCLRRLFASIESHEGAAAREKGLSLRSRPPRRATVLSDPVLLERILRNLLGNAMRHAERGSVLVGTRTRPGGELELQVWDTGVGIAPEHHSMIFEEFTQVGNVERDRSKGLGLGLAIVERSARLLGHPLDLRSWPGRGTCMSIVLPLAQQAPAQEAPAPFAPEASLEGCRAGARACPPSAASTSCGSRLPPWQGMSRPTC
jgi:signal transduction histidine kinase